MNVLCSEAEHKLSLVLTSMAVNEAWLYIDGHLNLRQVKRWPHNITDDDVVIRDGVGMHGSFSNNQASFTAIEVRTRDTFFGLATEHTHGDATEHTPLCHRAHSS